MRHRTVGVEFLKRETIKEIERRRGGGLRISPKPINTTPPRYRLCLQVFHIRGWGGGLNVSFFSCKELRYGGGGEEAGGGRGDLDVTHVGAGYLAEPDRTEHHHGNGFHLQGVHLGGGEGEGG